MSLFFKVANASAGTAINATMSKIVDNIISPIVAFVFALAVLLFVWGIVEYIIGGEDSEKRKTGQTHVLWGVIGIAIMVSVYGIIRFVASSVGQTAPF